MDEFRPLKDAFGRFATGVTVASCVGPDGEGLGITVNSFVSVSLQPPLVLWCIEKRAHSFLAFEAADAYGLSVLRAEQADVSTRFATLGNHDFRDGEAETWETGAPILKERLAAFDCRIVHRHDAGDHVILVGEVVRFDHRPGKPLIYVGSRYAEGPEI